MGVSKNRGKTPKMDGLFYNGKPVIKMDDLGFSPLFFGLTPIFLPCNEKPCNTRPFPHSLSHLSPHHLGKPARLGLRPWGKTSWPGICPMAMTKHTWRFSVFQGPLHPGKPPFSGPNVVKHPTQTCFFIKGKVVASAT